MKLDRSIFRTLLLLCMAAFVFASCDDDDDGSGDPDNGQNLVQVAGENTDLETFVTALQASGLTPAFEGTDQFTIFAPSNAAFADLGDQLGELLEQDNQDELADILRYHVIEGRRLSTALQTNANQSTLLASRTIAITVGNDGSVTIGDSTDEDANVETPNLEASNGVIHIIDKVLIPPPPTIAEIVTAAAEDETDNGLSDLAFILGLPAFQQLLTDAGDPQQELTVFAPTNKAFDDLLSDLGLDELSELRLEVVQDILNYHIAGDSVRLGEDTTIPTLLEGESVSVTQSGSLVDGISVDEDRRNIVASNGLVHVIKGVLLPSTPKAISETDDVVRTIYFRSGFTRLVEALSTSDADLIGALQMPGPFTVFAPTDEAFDALYAQLDVDGPGNIPMNTLNSTLLYHVLGGNVGSGDIVNGAGLETQNGDSVFFSLNDDGAFINAISIVLDQSDLTSGNGVVHTISSVLSPPPMGGIVGLVTANENQDGKYDALVAALTEAELVGVLQGPGPFTVFAPSNAAFTALYAALDAADENVTIDGPEDVDPATLEAVLLYHVVNGRTFSSDLSNGMMVPTNAGPAMNPFTFTVNIGDSGVTIEDGLEGNTDAGVGVGANAVLNQVATNGVIHDIDAVLRPPTAE